MAEAKASRIGHQRPLSPHLQIYRLTFTMVMSGLHRITGIFLYLGSVLMVWWLVAAASGPNAYAVVQWAASSWIGRLVLLGYTFTMMHHLFGGIRHLIWDTGRGYEPTEREWLARATLICSLFFTAVIWVVAYFIMGGL